KITDLLGKNFKGLKLFIIKTDLLEKIAFADQKAKYKNFSFLKNYSYNYNNYNQIFEQKNKFNLAVIEEINLKNKAKLESQLKAGNSFTISQRISGSYYTGTFIRITGVDGLTKGYLISYQADQALNFISQKFLNILIIAIAFLILSLILLRIIFLNNHKLRLLAHNDELTEINNRRHLTNVLTKEFNRHQRYNSSFAFIIFDIDYFKNVNDNYGHDEGDRILKELSELIKNNIRQSDHFGRWGGEEFVLLAPETELKAAYKLAEKLRKAIAAYNFIQAENITASFGIAVIENEENIEELIKRADNALYRAKAKGRNRVEVD
ncbi:MAG: GGDEF domain-containing protein, partial [Bacillota bacterium]